MPIQIRGTAHPPPPKNGRRTTQADLSRAEINGTNIAGRPLLNEHDSGSRVGTCLASWQGTDGSLRIAADVDDPTAIGQVRNGTLRGKLGLKTPPKRLATHRHALNTPKNFQPPGLSLGTDMILSEGGDVLYRNQAELSICAEGKRDNTWIDTIDGKSVHRTARFSKTQSGVRR